MIAEPFAHGESLLHTTDPACKLVGALVLVTVASLCTGIPAAASAFCLGLFVLAAARPALRPAMARLAAVNGFTAFLWVALPLGFEGRPLFELGPLAFDAQGFEKAAMITLKANAAAMIAVGMIATSPASALGEAALRLGAPMKAAKLFVYAYRQLFTTYGEYLRLRKSAKARGFQPGTNVHTYRTLSHLFAMTLVNSWDRAERIDRSMRMRGFCGRFYSLQDVRVGPRDRAVLGASLAAATAMAAIDLYESELQWTLFI